jgi:hypothetical protein
MQNVIYRLQDHFEVVEHLKTDRNLRHAPKRRESPLDWDALLAASERKLRPLSADIPSERLRIFANDAKFLKSLQRSYEWGDLELLLRTVRELGLDPLLLSMPMEYAHFERMGISPQTVDAYAWRLNDFAKRYQVPVVDFADLGEDPQFFADHFGHPSAKGWIYFNHALDDFYHGHPPRQRAPLPGDKEAPPSSPLTGRPPLPPSGPWSAIPGT